MRTAGLIDIQVNGFAGVDFNDPTLDAPALDYALEAMLRTGVTACLPTLITAPEAALGERLTAVDRAVANSRFGPAMVPGFHLEGPFLNPAPGFRGCHPPEAMVSPDPAMLERVTSGLTRPVLLLTIAPERDGAEAVIRWARGRGMVVAMGHTAADLAATERAIEAGVTLSTHLGNALPHTQHKFLNPLFPQLADDRLWMSVIADGIHVPAHVLKVFLRAKGVARSVLVTDATAGAAALAGPYHFAGMPIERGTDGSVRVPGQTNLAGSALTLGQAVRNLVAWGISDFESAIVMASANPAGLLAPALDSKGITLPNTAVIWSDDLLAASVTLGVGGSDVTIS